MQGKKDDDKKMRAIELHRTTNMTQAQIAAAVGVTQQAVSNYLQKPVVRRPRRMNIGDDYIAARLEK